MGQVLYRKYRSRNFDEVVGQDHIVQALKNSLKSGKISHAYLFTGPRGVGKTSIARILAHAVNDLDYQNESTNIDIIEIDAASNRRIDEIRDLREKARVLPVAAKYKVYIIDEVHMLTREAFNALLKTLEEPPAHVVFILATTEAHKLPATIISRTQRYSFKPIAANIMNKHLALIAKRENIEIEPPALEIIAKQADGSFRDAISLLDQTRGLSSPIDVSQVQSLLGVMPETSVDNLLELLREGDGAKLSHSLQDLARQSYNPVTLSNQIIQRLRQQLLASNSREEQLRLLSLSHKLLKVPSQAQPLHYLELILLEEALDKTSVNTDSKPRQANPETTPHQKTSTAKRVKQAKLDEQLWSSVLETIKEHHNTLYGILRMGSANFEGAVLVLSFEFPFHQRRISETKNKQIIIETIQKLCGQTVTIECRIHKPTTAAPTNENIALQTISNIFGDAEVLDS